MSVDGKVHTSVETDDNTGCLSALRQELGFWALVFGLIQCSCV